MVRVKTGGKSTRLALVIALKGKPYLEQDKTACWFFVPSCKRNMWVYRIDKWLPLRKQTESGL